MGFCRQYPGRFALFLLCWNERDGGTAVVNDDMGMQTPCWGYPVRWGGVGRTRRFICKQIREWGRPPRCHATSCLSPFVLSSVAAEAKKVDVAPNGEAQKPKNNLRSDASVVKICLLELAGLALTSLYFITFNTFLSETLVCVCEKRDESI